LESKNKVIFEKTFDKAVGVDLSSKIVLSIRVVARCLLFEIPETRQLN